MPDLRFERQRSTWRRLGNSVARPGVIIIIQVNICAEASSASDERHDILDGPRDSSIRQRLLPSDSQVNSGQTDIVHGRLDIDINR